MNSALDCEDFRRLLFDSGPWVGVRERVRDCTGAAPCIAAGLRQTVAAEDWRKFRRYLYAAGYHPSENYLEPLGTALSQHDEHIPNEDIVEVLVGLASPKSVDLLRETLAWRPDWDEFHQLAVKCLWALAGIESDDARAVIDEAASDDRPVVRDTAESAIRRRE